ncbi:DivIVA domain-containing protein [Balneola vulgaris]|uniref:DivIVA domain-containing protein n=1 Tax=Balneola vulgaris TaxID=287535 RepID=UPI00035CFA1E|nr:DivIVA domain-containing protein [Balneola vulgaris]
MKLTPLEIKQQQFEKALRGYDVTDVQSFLTLVSNEVEHLLNKNKELEDQIEKLNDRVRHYERVEEALHETLQTTKESVAQKLDGAKTEADNRIAKAEMQAEAIIKDANHQRLQIRQNILRLLDKREEIIAGMSSYLENSMKSLDQFGKDEAGVYSVPKEEALIQSEVQEEETTSSDDQDVEAEETENKSSRFQLDMETPDNESSLEDEDHAYPPGSDRLDDILDELD